MIIAVDVRELTGHPTGVGRYLTELLTEWANIGSALVHEWRLYAHTEAVLPAVFRGSLRPVPGNGGTMWEQWSLMRALSRDRPDVLFAPSYTAPLTAPCPIALTVHDVSFAAHPEWFTMREGLRRRLLTSGSARRAKVLITDSEFSKREITQRFGIPPGRVRVIPLGVRSLSGIAAPSAAREPVILYVGSLFRRRHVDRLIHGFAKLIAPRVPDSRLEIVGENRMYPPLDFERTLSELPPSISDRVTLRSYVDEATLNQLYRRASVFAFLSEYEGFGLTPLEALAAGVPSVVLDTAVAREVYGKAARFVDATNDAAFDHTLGTALFDLLTDESARADVLQHARPVLTKYNWGRTAAETLSAISEAAGA
jgi:glycosyltransferase involved in cell wall biosynthesis